MQPSQPFAIRSLANHGTELERLRHAILQAPAHSNMVLLLQRGPESVHFPFVCVCCEQPASSTLRIERLFLFFVENGGEGAHSTRQSIDAFDVPFCNACVQRQRVEQTASSPWTPLLRILSEAEGLAGIVVMAIALLFVARAISYLDITLLVFAILPASTGYWLMQGPWKRSRYMSLPEPTNVDLAVDFTPILSLAFEPAWQGFQFRSARYAALFREANSARKWNPQSVEAQSAATLRRQDSFWQKYT